MDYVLVHGTTQSPAGWQRLAGAMARRVHRVHAVDLPTDQPGLLAGDYASMAAGQLPAGMTGPVVVAHSGGCLVLPALARELRARRMVWLAGYVPDPAGGRSFADEIRACGAEIFTSEWRSLTEPPTADPIVAAYFLFHDCDLATLRWAVSTLRLFFPAGAYQEVPAAADGAPPSTYVLPRADRVFRPEWMRAAARERLGCEPVEVDGGHCPYVCEPEAIAEVLHQRA